VNSLFIRKKVIFKYPYNKIHSTKIIKIRASLSSQNIQGAGLPSDYMKDSEASENSANRKPTIENGFRAKPVLEW